VKARVVKYQLDLAEVPVKIPENPQRLLRQAENMDVMDELWNELLAGAPLDQRTLCNSLYLAAWVVALNGCDAVPEELAKLAVQWRAGRDHSAPRKPNVYRTTQAVKTASKPRSRLSENVPLDEAKAIAMPPRNAENRTDRKRKR